LIVLPTLYVVFEERSARRQNASVAATYV